jgi:hypothetical protein
MGYLSDKLDIVAPEEKPTGWVKVFGSYALAKKTLLNHARFWDIREEAIDAIEQVDLLAMKELIDKEELKEGTITGRIDSMIALIQLLLYTAAEGNVDECVFIFKDLSNISEYGFIKGKHYPAIHKYWK